MRNLKKVLALVLALVMAMSLITIANAADFSDDADIDYDEAVDVMVAAGIIDGVGNNSFDPNGTLTREQAAKLITYMLLGENSDKLGVESTSFKDVAATRWSAPAIEYCASLGIIDGAGDGNFYPAGKLTGYAFAKMLLTAIGYDSETEKFVGNGWTIPVATIGLEVGLNNGMEKMFGAAEISRQEAAQMALNAIKAPLVQYPNKGNSVSVNGVVVDFSSQQAEYVTTTLAKEQRISDQRLSNSKEFTVEFGEKYLPKLEMKSADDAFGRPSYTWLYDKKEIGTYVDYTNLVGEFTEKVTGRDLYDLITKATLDDSTVTIYIDGETEKTVLNDYGYFTQDNILKSNTDTVGETGKGVLTQVFVDTDVDNHSEVTIAIINTYLAKADSDYNDKKDEVTFDVWSLDEVTTNKKLVKDKSNETNGDGRIVPIKVSGEDFAIEDVKKDDIVLVTVADKTIQTIDPIEVVSGVSINSFKDGSWVKVDGTQYDYASTAQYDVDVLDDYSQNNMKDKTYNIYLDPYGYLIGVELIEEDAKYVFLTGIDTKTSNLTKATAEGNIITLDGEIETVRINLDKSKNAAGNKFINGDNDINDDGTGVTSLMNTWCTYSVDKNGVYTLTEVANTQAQFDAKGVKAGQSRNESYGTASNYTDPATKTKTWKAYKSSYDAANSTQIVGKRDVIEIDKKHVTLNGIAGSNVVKAYGNESTIYLSAETSLIEADATIYNSTGADAVVISGVSGISTGVRDTSLTAYTAQGVMGEGPTEYKDNTTIVLEDISHGVYTLFNNKGYVIAAVVVGEDGGANSNYVYVTSDKASQEGYSSADDEWTWTREVIINGQAAEITEKGDSLDVIGNKLAEGNMQQGEWWKVTYKADGTVHSAEKINFANAAGNKYIDEVKKVEASLDAEDTVVLYTDLTAHTNIITVEGNTLHIEAAGTQANHEGFAVAPDAKIALVQDTKVMSGDTVRRIDFMDKIYEYDNGVNGLAKAVKDMNDNEEFKGYIGAIFEGGLATSIVIYDKTETEVDYGSGTGTEGIISTTFNGTDRVDILYAGSVPSGIAQLNAIIAELKDQDNVERVEGAKLNGDGTFDATLILNDGSTMTLDGAAIVLATSTMDSEGLDDMIDKIGDQGATSYEFGGTVTMDSKTKTVTFTGGYGADGQTEIETTVDGVRHDVTLLDDIARFLGGLYRQMGVRAIEFDGEDYTWSPADANNLKGSNWYGTDATLVADIGTASGAAIAANNSTVDGVEFEMVLDGVTWTIKIALG